ncbi:hypothetical protein ACOME3_010542, partial [Neoechinorhynchus agilis]
MERILDDLSIQKDSAFMYDVCEKFHKIALAEVEKMLSYAREVHFSVQRSKEKLIRLLNTKLRWLINCEHDIYKCDTDVRMLVATRDRLRSRVKFIDQFLSCPRLIEGILQEAERRKM